MGKEKESISISYKGSGVKTTNAFSRFFFIIGGIATLFLLPGISMLLLGNPIYDEVTTGTIIVSITLPTTVLCFGMGAICKAISTMAKTSLFKKTLLENQYHFYDLSE